MTRSAFFEIQIETYPSPVGTLFLGAYEEKACFVGLNEIPSFFKQSFFKLGSQSIFSDFSDQLKAYFEGKLKSFNLPIHFFYGTSFQHKVWNTLATIPYAKTQSYEWLANQVKAPKAFRAAGSANAKNPLPIILPCHRIIQKNGSLGGYAGGIKMKNQLLKHEEKNVHRN